MARRPKFNLDNVLDLSYEGDEAGTVIDV